MGFRGQSFTEAQADALYAQLAAANHFTQQQRTDGDFVARHGGTHLTEIGDVGGVDAGGSAGGIRINGDTKLVRKAANDFIMDAVLRLYGRDLYAQQGTAARIRVGTGGPGGEPGIVLGDGSGGSVVIYRSAADEVTILDKVEVETAGESMQIRGTSSTRVFQVTNADASSEYMRVGADGVDTIRQLRVFGGINISGQGDVSYGANDSAGAGFRIVRVPNL